MKSSGVTRPTGFSADGQVDAFSGRRPAVYLRPISTAQVQWSHDRSCPSTASRRMIAWATRGSPGRATVAIVRRRLRGVAFDGASFVMFSFVASAALDLSVGEVGVQGRRRAPGHGGLGSEVAFSPKCGNAVRIDLRLCPRRRYGADCGSGERPARESQAKRLSKATDEAYFARRLRAGAGTVVALEPRFFARAGTTASASTASASPVSDCRSISGSR